jgi:hypothetical protein
VIGTLVGIVTAVVPVCVIGYSLLRGQCVESVDSNGKVSFCPTSSRPVSPGPSSVSEPARQPIDSPSPKVLDVGGAWIGANGLTYDVQQHGTQLVIQEQGPYGGITATGHGRITGTSVQLSWQALNGATGLVNLTLSSDGQHLQGSSTSTYAGMAVFELSR